jgi:hypothetical protein
MRYLERPVFIVVVVLSTASSVFAQTHVWEGGVMPMMFDAHGARHYYTYGYNGPLVPPIESRPKTENRNLRTRNETHSVMR